MKNFHVNAVGLRRPLFRMIPLLLVLGMAGCGDVEWFPPYVRLATTPDAFSFAAKPSTELAKDVTSDPITVRGLTAATSPISITGSTVSSSKYSVNGATATSADGTVKNGDTVTVTHTSSSDPGNSTTSTLFIGAESAKFVSTTRNIADLTFSTPVPSGQYMQAYATVKSFDGVAGTHVISIKDSISSGNALYSVSDNLEPTTFSNATQTIPFLNGRKIFVKNLAATIATPATTTLTIDGIDTVVNLTPP